jgi:hypothetical protein
MGLIIHANPPGAAGAGEAVTPIIYIIGIYRAWAWREVPSRYYQVGTKLYIGFHVGITKLEPLNRLSSA